MRRVLVLAAVASALTPVVSTQAAVPQPVYFWGSVAATIAAPGQPSLPLVSRPDAIALFADGSWDVEQLEWSGWGTSVARATGISSSSTGSPSQAEGKRIKTAATVTLSDPGPFQGHEVYRCFSLEVPPPATSMHLCLEETGGYWGLSSVPSKPAHPTTSDFRVRAIAGGCSMRTSGVVCVTYTTPAHVARLKPSGAVTLCTGTAIACREGDFGEGTPTYRTGKAVTLGRFRCQVVKAGVRCTVAATGKGFLMTKTGATRVR